MYKLTRKLIQYLTKIIVKNTKHKEHYVVDDTEDLPPMRARLKKQLDSFGIELSK